MKLFKKKCQCEKGFLKVSDTTIEAKRFMIYPPIYFVSCPCCGKKYKATKEGDKYILEKEGSA